MRSVLLYAGGMLRASTAAGLRRYLERQTGVFRADVDVFGDSVRVEYDEELISPDAVRGHVSDFGLRCGKHATQVRVGSLWPRRSARPVTDTGGRWSEATPREARLAPDATSELREVRTRVWVSVLLALPVLLSTADVVAWFGEAPRGMLDLATRWVPFLFASAAVLWGGWPYFLAAWRALRCRACDATILIALTLGVSYLAGVGALAHGRMGPLLASAVVLLVIVLLGQWLELRARSSLASMTAGGEARASGVAGVSAYAVVVVAVALALASFTTSYYLAGTAFLVALVRAVAVLAVANPDVLVLAPSAATRVGTALAASHGIGGADAATLDSLGRVRTMVFHGPEALGVGEPEVVEAIAAPGTSDELFVSLVASAQQTRDEPTARAIMSFARWHGFPLADVDAVESSRPEGIAVRVDGHLILSGSREWLWQHGVELTTLDRLAGEVRAPGRSVLYNAMDGQAAGILAIADPLQPTARLWVSELNHLGVATVLLAKGGGATATRIGQALGMACVLTAGSTADAAETIARWRRERGPVAVVAAGSPDSNLMHSADLQVLRGEALSPAIAGLRLPDGDPGALPHALRLARATARTRRRSLGFAIAYNVLALPAAAGLFATQTALALRPVAAVVLASISSFLVLRYASSAGRLRPPRRGETATRAGPERAGRTFVNALGPPRSRRRGDVHAGKFS